MAEFQLMTPQERELYEELSQKHREEVIFQKDQYDRATLTPWAYTHKRTLFYCAYLGFWGSIMLMVVLSKKDMLNLGIALLTGVFSIGGIFGILSFRRGRAKVAWGIFGATMIFITWSLLF